VDMSTFGAGRYLPEPAGCVCTVWVHKCAHKRWYLHVYVHACVCVKDYPCQLQAPNIYIVMTVSSDHYSTLRRRQAGMVHPF
jgi:hypothetical protein